MSDPIDAKYLKTVLDKRDLQGRMQKFRDEQDDKPITDTIKLFFCVPGSRSPVASIPA